MPWNIVINGKDVREKHTSWKGAVRDRKRAEHFCYRIIKSKGKRLKTLLRKQLKYL